MSWVALIPPSHDLAANAWQSIRAILEDVGTEHYLRNAPTTIHSRYEDAILFAYMCLGTSDELWYRRCIERLNDTIEHDTGRIEQLALFGGLCGLGWSVEHISRIFVERSSQTQSAGIDVSGDGRRQDLNEDIDVAAISALRSIAGGNFDLISGLVGYGLYFLERWPFGRSEEGLSLVIKALEGLAENFCGMRTWHTTPDQLPNEEQQRWPEGYYNFGVAHGVPGVVSFLWQVAGTGIETKTVCCLLDGAIAWLVAKSGSDAGQLRFKAWMDPCGRTIETRPAWCYGDLGIAAVLLELAEEMSNSALHKLVLEMLETCLALPVELFHVRDAGLCHGASGVAHIYNRIYQQLGDERFRDAALKWYELLLTMPQPGTGIGGYSKYTITGPGGTPVWQPWPALLDGSIGVALALLAAITPVEPHWDRLLLLSSRLTDANRRVFSDGRSAIAQVDARLI